MNGANGCVGLKVSGCPMCSTIHCCTTCDVARYFNQGRGKHPWKTQRCNYKSGGPYCDVFQVSTS